jgi:GT2 family glycosyltransferase
MPSLNANFNDERISLLTNVGYTDYCSQINFAVKEVKTKYFSILGFDDEYSLTWFKNVEKYIEHMPEYSMFLPIISYINKEGDVVGSINEIIWAMSFSNEIGVIDEDTLQSYYDFSPNGAIFRTDDFIEVGMLKPSIKLAFWYEFLLRAANQGLKIYVIPKNGYLQLIEREGSILEKLSKEMDEDERAWWIKLANKEYYFKQERKKSYKYVSEKLSDIDGLK